MALTASTVSRHLWAAGFPISQDRNRQGVRVSRGALRGQVCIAVDLDTPGRERRLAETLAEWLDEADTSLGWAYKRNDGDNSLFSVWRREPEQAPTPAPAQLRRPERLQPPKETPVDDSLVSRAVGDMAAGKVVSFTTAPVRVPLPTEQSTRLQREHQAGKLAAAVTASTTRLRQAIYNGTAPAQADITAARTALEALIELAGGDQ